FAPHQALHFIVNEDLTTQFGILDSGNYTPPYPIRQSVIDISGKINDWIQVTTVYNQSDSSLTSYINGQLADHDFIPEFNLDMSGGIWLGDKSANTKEDYTGLLDEMRISTVVRGPQWIKLTYESQKPGAAVVSIE
ncbi:MAG: LamG domain-containing protein, partial [Planctomycetes bacterium]|nr:LamG domain-containing protein [Planctomycetota bacterium]